MTEAIEKAKAAKIAINYDRIKKALPVETGNGRRSTVRA